MQSKSILASKTFWTNIIAVVASVFGVFGIEGLDPEAQATIVAGVMAVANIVLRLVTRGPVHIR